MQCLHLTDIDIIYQLEHYLEVSSLFSINIFLHIQARSKDKAVPYKYYHFDHPRIVFKPFPIQSKPKFKLKVQHN
jgi:hypothetical protein